MSRSPSVVASVVTAVCVTGHTAGVAEIRTKYTVAREPTGDERASVGDRVGVWNRPNSYMDFHDGGPRQEVLKPISSTRMNVSSDRPIRRSRPLSVLRVSRAREDGVSGGVW